MTTKVNLNQIADSFDKVSKTTLVYYLPDSGKIDIILHDNSIAYFDNYEDEDIPTNAIFLPSKFEINEYEIMEDFVHTIKDDEVFEELRNALSGREAIANFKQQIKQLGIKDDWLAFRNNAFMDLAREWCNWNKLDWEE